MAYNVLIMYILWNGSIKLISILMTLHTLKTRMSNKMNCAELTQNLLNVNVLDSFIST